jgi:triacylglycerol lipase
MLKKMLAVVLFVLTGCVAAGTNESYATKYPVLFVHGLGFRDDLRGFGYWGSIPTELTKAGCRVFLSDQDAWDPVETNARQIRERIVTILSQTGCRKVNIIAHSKGGLDCRYMISRMGMSSNVATLTMISTPNRGTPLADIILKEIGGTNDRLVADLFDLFARIIGDSSPESIQASLAVATNGIEAFNDENPDMPGVYYQSYGCALLDPVSQPEFRFSYKLIRKFTGANDGVVPVSSAVWGDYRGTLTGKYGVSHLDIIQIGGENVDGFDVVGFYKGLVSELKKKGY